MSLTHDLANYQHPYVTVDGVLFRIRNVKLEVKLVQQPKLDGQWSLPGGFVSVNRLAVDTLQEKMQEKANVSGFYAEQLQTYDALDRDERGRVISIAYLCLTNDMAEAPGWFTYMDGKLSRDSLTLSPADLAFDHGQIIQDARQRLVNKLWYSDLAKYLLPDIFKISDAQKIYEMLEDVNYFSNFKRKLGNRVVEVGEKTKESVPGRRAELYRWATTQKGI